MAVRKLGGAVVDAAMSVMFAMADDPKGELVELYDEAMAHLEAGPDL